MLGLPIVTSHAGSMLIDDSTAPDGARRYHWPTAGPLPGTPAAYSGSFGAVRRRRRWSGTAYSTSGSCARRCASAVEVMPDAKITWVRSDTPAPLVIAMPSRVPSDCALLSSCAFAEPALALNNAESAFSLTITRALPGSAAGEAVCADATNEDPTKPHNMMSLIAMCMAPPQLVEPRNVGQKARARPRLQSFATKSTLSSVALRRRNQRQRVERKIYKGVALWTESDHRKAPLFGDVPHRIAHNKKEKCR